MNTSRWATKSPAPSPAPVTAQEVASDPKPDSRPDAEQTSGSNRPEEASGPIVPEPSWEPEPNPQSLQPQPQSQHHTTTTTTTTSRYEGDSYPPQDISLEDEFAQTRPPDDLFDDDFTPFEDSQPAEIVQPGTAEQTSTMSQAAAATTTTAPATTFAAATPPTQPRADASQSQRGVPRGPRRGNVSRHAGTASSRYAANGGQANHAANGSTTNATTPAATAATPEDATADGSSVAKSLAQSTTTTLAVRGDRSGTGGPKHKKLSEDELSAKLAAMKVKNASLMEKHARSQADEDSFKAREAVAARKRAEEKVNRQAMMGEREKNRQRKLKAQGGREWDLEKDEEQFAEKRGNRRGAFGGVAGGRRQDTPDAAPEVDEERRQHDNGFRGRGRGGRAGRGGRGSHQESRQGPPKMSQQQQQQQSQQLPSASDFPDLPETAKVDGSKAVEPAKTLEFPIKSKQALDKSMAELVAAAGAGTGKTSWADEVEQTS